MDSIWSLTHMVKALMYWNINVHVRSLVDERKHVYNGVYFGNKKLAGREHQGRF